MEDRTIESFLCFRGSVVWPHNLQPGLILLAGEMRIRLVPKIDQVIICEAQEFKTANEAANIFNARWDRYLPFGYFHHYIKNHGFTNHLLDIEDMRNKVTLLYLRDPEKPENIDCGIALIRDYLQADDKLIFQKDGTEILSSQLKNISFDDEAQRYKITALRYLLTGIHDNPWEPTYDYDDEPQYRRGRSSITGY